MGAADDSKWTLRRAVRDWVRQPGTWLSLLSLAVSGATIAYVKFYPGTIKIYLPAQVAVYASEDASMAIAVNTSLVNDAPPNHVKIVEDASLRLRWSDRALECGWVGTTELIPTRDFEIKYGKLEGPAKEQLDQFAPQNRVAPFSIKAQELQARTLLFSCRDPGVAHGGTPVLVEVTMTVKTEGTRYSSAPSRYELSREQMATSLKNKSWEWIERK